MRGEPYLKNTYFVIKFFKIRTIENCKTTLDDQSS